MWVVLISGGSSSGNMVFIASLVVIAVTHWHNLLHCCLPETAEFFLSVSWILQKKIPHILHFLLYYHDSEIPCLGFHWRELSVFHLVKVLEIASNWWALWIPCVEQKHHLASHTHKNLHIFPKTKIIMNRWIIYLKFTSLPLANLSLTFHHYDFQGMLLASFLIKECFF